MDKNTMYGMLLMGAVLLGFMWLNQPEPQPGPAPDMEVTQEQAQAAADNLLASPSDSLTRGQLVMLADAVARYGVQDSTGTGRIDRDGIVLTGNGTEVTGHVRVDSVDVPVGMLANPAMALTSSGISSRAYSDAVARVKTLLRDLTQYQGFARYLQGKNDTVRLANDLISLDISTKGAMIATAELSKYDSFRGGNVKVISGNDDAYSFILSSADREFDTRDFYFRPTEVTDSSVLMSLDLGNVRQPTDSELLCQKTRNPTIYPSFLKSNVEFHNFNPAYIRLQHDAPEESRRTHTWMGHKATEFIPTAVASPPPTSG